MIESLLRAARERLVRVVEEVSERYHEAAQEHAERRHREQLEALRHETDRAIQTMRDVVHEFEVRTRRDLFAAGERTAAASSARFVNEAMAETLGFPHPDDTLQHALSLAPAGGLALEFGVWSGRTLKSISTAREGRDVFGFDSFEGLPTTWRAGFPAGTFGDTELPDVPGAELIVGWFDDTLPDFMAAHPGPVSFLHVDADLYSSAVTVLEHVGPRLQTGSVVIFDEYFNYPGWEQHEHRAWQEYVERSGTGFRYEAYTMNNEQVVVVVTAPAES